MHRLQFCGWWSVSCNYNLSYCFLTHHRSHISPTGDYSRYSSEDNTIVFQGTTTEQVNVLYHVVDDSIAEPNETLKISIAKATASNNITADFNISNANITIIDDDGEDS